VKLFGFVIALALCAGACAEVEISLAPDGRSFVASGASDGSEFVVRVDGDSDLPPMAGEVDAVEGGLRFTPSFPLTPGVGYRASLGEDDRVFMIPEADMTPVARVAAVYPTADELPENLLKFYLHFSEPMAAGEAAKNVRLIGPEGKEEDLPFLELAEELWDPDGKRLTLFFDPGRVKRGLKPNEEHGRALAAGKDYELQIDATWRDAKGRAMAEGFTKKFRAVGADYAQPDARKWTIISPKAGTRDELRLTFSEALDHGLLGRLLTVYGSDDRALSGVVRIGNGEKDWYWKPDEPWTAGDYRVEIEAILEDVAGNSVARLFEEVDGVKETWTVRDGRFVQIPFEIQNF
jgi:hypothetical protein